MGTRRMSPDACSLSSATGSVVVSPFLLALGAEVADGFAGRFAQSIGIERAFLKSADDGIAKLVDFLFGHSELERRS